MYSLIPEVCGVLASILIPLYIPFPNKQKWLQIAHGFQEICDYSNCIGPLDGSEIETQRPPHSAAQFQNYKKFPSITLMATCDAYRKFTWFNFGDYGKYQNLTNTCTIESQQKCFILLSEKMFAGSNSDSSFF